VLDWLLDKTEPAPPEWLHQILWGEVGRLRQPRQSDNRSALQDLAESTDDDTRLEALIHRQLHERLKVHFPGKDIRIYLEVTFFRPPLPLLVAKMAVTEGETLHPQARVRVNLDFGPVET
jgi:hypothetical protein